MTSLPRSPVLEDAEHCLADLTGDPNAVYEMLIRLSDEDLNQLFLPYVMLNLRSLALPLLDEVQLHSRSRANLLYLLFQGWLYRAYLSRGPIAMQAYYPFESGSSDAIGEALPISRPAIICSFHLGEYRFLVDVLCRLGHKVLATMDEASFQELNPLLVATQNRLASFDDPLAAAFQNLAMCSVEQPSAVLRMRRHLAEGGLLVLYLDGNTGSTGLKNNPATQHVSFGPYTLNVRNGAARLATRCGVPLYLLLVEPRPHTSRELKISRIGKVIKQDEALDDYVSSTTQAMWSRFFEAMKGSEEYWESLRFLHRWRIAPQDEADIVVPEQMASVGPSPYMQYVRLTSGHVWMNASTLAGISSNMPEAAVLDFFRNNKQSDLSGLSQALGWEPAETLEVCQRLFTVNALRHMVEA